MVVLLDIDGVVADLVGALCRHLPGRTPESVTTYRFADCFSDEELAKVYQRMESPKFCMGIPAYAGAREYVDFLRKHSRVVAVTAPWDMGPLWAYERKRWIRQHLDIDAVVSTNCKELVRGDVLVEDCPDNCIKWLAANPDGRCELIDRPWNRGFEMCAVSRRFILR